MEKIISISKHNISEASHTLFLSFKDDPLLLWLFGGENYYDRKAISSIKTWINWCMKKGFAIATTHCESVCLWKKPNQHAFTFLDLLSTKMLFTPCVLNPSMVKRILMFDRLIKSAYLKAIGSENFWYCWLLGTEVQYRQQGYGKALMNYIHQIAKQSHLPCCLETSKEDNVYIYEKLGYSVISEIKIPYSRVNVYCMMR